LRHDANALPVSNVKASFTAHKLKKLKLELAIFRVNGLAGVLSRTGGSMGVIATPEGQKKYSVRSSNKSSGKKAIEIRLSRPLFTSIKHLVLTKKRCNHHTECQNALILQLLGLRLQTLLWGLCPLLSRWVAAPDPHFAPYHDILDPPLLSRLSTSLAWRLQVEIGNESVSCAENYNIYNTINLFLKTAISILVISDHNSFRVLFDKIASVFYLKNIFIF